MAAVKMARAELDSRTDLHAALATTDDGLLVVLQEQSVCLVGAVQAEMC